MKTSETLRILTLITVLTLLSLSIAYATYQVTQIIQNRMIVVQVYDVAADPQWFDWGVYQDVGEAKSDTLNLTNTGNLPIMIHWTTDLETTMAGQYFDVSMWNGTQSWISGPIHSVEISPGKTLSILVRLEMVEAAPPSPNYSFLIYIRGSTS